MAKTWFSYTVLAIGLMMLFSSDRTFHADDVDVIEKEIQIFVNKQGDEQSSVSIDINGKKVDFALPELADGESKTFSLDDGTEVIVKAVSGHNKIWIDGEQLDLPVMGMHGGSEGLHSMITRVSPMMHFGGADSDSVTIQADVSDDAMAALKDAVQNVLSSYGIDKKVVVHKAPKMQFISIDGENMHGNHFEVLKDGEVKTIDIKGGDDGVIHKIEVIKKEKKDDDS